MVEVSCLPFKFKHLELLKEMHQLRKYPHTELLSMKNLPKVGYIAIIGSQPIAAGFLRRLEGGYGQIDTLVSNPFVGSILRNEGIRQIVDTLLMDAKCLRLEGIISYTNDSGVLSRAKDLGFNELDQRVIVLKL